MESTTTESSAPVSGQSYTHHEINDWIRGNNQRGIRYSGNFPDIRRVGVIILRDSPYRDIPGGGSIRYVGEGLVGDQKLTIGNRVLAQRFINGGEVHVFRQRSDGRYRYLGEHTVEGVSSEIQPDDNDEPRGVFVFELTPAR